MNWLTDSPFVTQLGLEGARIVSLQERWAKYVSTGSTTAVQDDWSNLQNVEDVMRFLQKELNISGTIDDMITGYDIVVIARPIKETK